MVLINGKILGPSSSFIGVLHFVVRFTFRCKLSHGHCRSVFVRGEVTMWVRNERIFFVYDVFLVQRSQVPGL